jgi:hypothetical protein
MNRTKFDPDDQPTIPERFLPTDADLWHVGVKIIDHIDKTRSLDIAWLVRLLSGVVPTRQDDQ